MKSRQYQLIGNMIKFVAQIHSKKQTTMGDNIIVLRVDESQTESLKDLFMLKIGTECYVGLEPTDPSFPSAPEVSAKDLKEKSWSMMHALINDLAELRDEKPEEVKKRLKERLIKEGMIEKSTKELEIKGLAIACNLLRDWIQEYGK